MKRARIALVMGSICFLFIALLLLLRTDESTLSSPRNPEGPSTSSPLPKTDDPQPNNASPKHDPLQTRDASAEKKKKRKIQRFLSNLQNIIETKGYCSFGSMCPPPYFLDRASYDSVLEMLKDNPSLASLVEAHILSLGRHHPSGRIALGMLDAVRKDVPEINDRIRIINKKLDDIEIGWLHEQGRDKTSARDSDWIFQTLTDESVALGARLYFLTLLPSDPEVRFHRLKKEDVENLTALAEGRKGSHPLVRSAAVHRLVSTLTATREADLLRAAIPVLAKTYQDARFSWPGVVFEIVNNYNLTSNLMQMNSELVPNLRQEERIALSRMLGDVLVAELRSSVAEGKIMAPYLDATLRSLNWRVAVEHYDYGRELLLTSATSELRRLGLALICPSDYSSKRFHAETEAAREQASLLLLEALRCETDETLRDTIAFKLSDLACRDRQVLESLETALEWADLSPETKETLRRYLSTTPDRPDR